MFSRGGMKWMGVLGLRFMCVIKSNMLWLRGVRVVE
jgi:hypothetical protein